MYFDPLQWWRNNAALFPHIADIARRHLALCASSAESERIFSQLALQLGSRRGALKLDLLHAIIVLRLNMDMW
jgi:hypothetical protein